MTLSIHSMDEVFLDFPDKQKIEEENKNKFFDDISHHTEINIFYHMFCINDSLDRFNRTFIKIKKSGLLNVIDNIYINCVGLNKIIFSDKTKNIDKKIKVFIGSVSNSEVETLNLLRDFSIMYPNGKSLYLHSKGCWRNYLEKQSEITKKSVQDWIDCMEYFLIEEFDNCLDILNKYDTCGILYKGNHYAGNFWWTRNSHVSNLPRCTNKTRHDSELKFICSKNGKHKELYKYTTNQNEYFTLHHRSLYTNKEPLI